jgi:Fic family protein
MAMFEPNFRYTDSIVNRLVEITSATHAVSNAFLVPKWDVSLRHDALVIAAHASTSIEGNPLSLDEVTRLAEGREVMATRRSKQEVLNYLDVLRNIERYAKKGHIEERGVLSLHGDVSKEVLKDPSHEGRYRDTQVVVANSVTGKVIFVPPPPDEVPKHTKDLVLWIDSDKSSNLHPVLVAGIAHYEFVRIHPFVDGNGRTARALATLILVTRGFDIKRFFALDDYYDSNRPNYYQVLNKVDQESLDLTGWLEYFTEGVLVAISRVRERVLELSTDRRKMKQRGQIALTTRQMEILEAAIRDGRITSGDVAKRYRISPQAARKELRKMIDLGILERKGEGRASHFVPT